MKNIRLTVSLILVALLIFGSFSIGVGAINGDDYAYTVLEDGTLCIDRCTTNSADLQIPSTLVGKTVSKIGDKAFEYNTAIKSISIPDCVTAIGERAFNECVNLTTVSFGGGLTEIGKDAFFSCTRLNNLTLPDTLTTLGDGAFYDCKSLENITVPKSVTSFGEYVFGYNDALTSAVIEEGITELPALTFYGDESLTEVTLPSSLTKIGRKAFYNNSKMTHIEIPTAVSEIGEKAFYSCRALTELSFNGEAIGELAFSECNMLSALNLTGSLKTVGGSILKNSGSLSTLALPNTVENIAPQAFSGSALTSVTVENGCENYISDSNAIYNADKTELVACIGAESFFNVPEGVEKIGDYAFFGSSPENVNLPSTLKSIGDYAFSTSSLMNLIIPEGVESIGEGAFAECSNLSFVNLPSTVNEVSAKAFFNDNSLAAVILNDGITSIADDAFSQCGSLEHFALSEDIKKLSANSFISSSIVTALNTEGNSNFVIENGALYSADKTELIICAGAEDNASEFTVPEGVSKIGDSAFSFNPNILTVNVPAAVTEIGKDAFGTTKYNDSKNSGTKYELKLIGEPFSAAQIYAKENDVAFFTHSPKLSTEALNLKGGESYTLSLDGADEADVVFSSSNNSIAAVDQSGKITAKGNGTTAVIASVSNAYFICRVTVTDGITGIDDPYRDYSEITRDTCEAWMKDYYKANEKNQFSIYDYPAVFCYTSEQYVPIVATQSGGKYLEETKAAYGDDYRQYYTISDNLSKELSNFTLHTGTVLFSGTGDVSLETDTDSTMKAMKAAVGRRFTDPAVISTSIAYDVANMFSAGSNYGTVLEIYAPKGLSKGAYIQSISKFESEYELLLDKDIEYEVLDAGYKEVTFDSFPITTVGDGSPRTTTAVKRFMKLLIVDKNSEDETTADETSSETTVIETTAAETTAKPTATEAAASPTTETKAKATEADASAKETQKAANSAAAAPTSATTAASAKTSAGTVKTGDARTASVLIAMLLMFAAYLIIIYRKSPDEEN